MIMEPSRVKTVRNRRLGGDSKLLAVLVIFMTLELKTLQLEDETVVTQSCLSSGST